MNVFLPLYLSTAEGIPVYLTAPSGSDIIMAQKNRSNADTYECFGLTGVCIFCSTTEGAMPTIT